MLNYLHVKNIALIDEIEVNFDEKLNILTGETGVGKSVLINSINFALGERANKELIRTGEEFCLVEVQFEIKSKKTIENLSKIDIELDENTLIISRKMTNIGKNLCKVNGQTVTIATLKEITGMIIDIHGQHEHQSLLNISKHIEILDQFCEEELETLKQKLHNLYQSYKNINQDIQNLHGDEKERQRKIDLLSFQVDEINNAKLKKDEEQNLLDERLKLLNSSKITKAIEKAYALLYSGFKENASAIDQVGESLKAIEKIMYLDENLKSIHEILENASIYLNDVTKELQYYSESIGHDESKLDDIENRLDLIDNLKRKYGNNIEEVLKYKDSIEKELDFIVHSEEKLKQLNILKENVEQEILKLCKQISDIRIEKSIFIKEKIEEILQDLQMKNIKFFISIKQKENFTDNGFDEVEFLFSSNQGEEAKSLAKIASGGEMSRIMLALKTVLADVDNIETLIFDEIDTGISGKTAQKVAEKLNVIAKTHQVICITHSPQIAAMADQHYVIEKKELQEKMATYITKLQEKEMIKELARLISGVEITELSLKNAEEMKQMAKKRCYK